MGSQKYNSLLELWFFVRPWYDTFNWNATKEPQKVSYLGQILLKGHDASFEVFAILLKESSKFKLHLNESFLIKRDKPELNRNVYS